VQGLAIKPLNARQLNEDVEVRAILVDVISPPRDTRRLSSGLLVARDVAGENVPIIPGLRCGYRFLMAEVGSLQ
jgi:hypothetical protein